MELEIRLTRGEPVYVSCDKYEEEETDNGGKKRWLVVYRGGQRIGRYSFDEIVGYHETPPTAPPQRMR
jgi:hypothetical protein